MNAERENEELLSGRLQLGCRALQRQCAPGNSRLAAGCGLGLFAHAASPASSVQSRRNARVRASLERAARPRLSAEPTLPRAHSARCARPACARQAVAAWTGASALDGCRHQRPSPQALPAQREKPLRASHDWQASKAVLSVGAPAAAAGTRKTSCGIRGNRRSRWSATRQTVAARMPTRATAPAPRGLKSHCWCMIG